MSGFLDKVKGLVKEREGQIRSAVDKAGDFVDEKTKGKYHDKITKANEKAGEVIDKATDKAADGDTKATDASAAGTDTTASATDATTSATDSATSATDAATPAEAPKPAGDADGAAAPKAETDKPDGAA